MVAFTLFGEAQKDSASPTGPDSRYDHIVPVVFPTSRAKLPVIKNMRVASGNSGLLHVYFVCVLLRLQCAWIPHPGTFATGQ